MKLTFGTSFFLLNTKLLSAYDHEHGSAAPYLMNYRPKYGYTEFKKSRDIESNQGFKDHVIKHGEYFVYVSSHVQTSSLRRTSVRLHTVTIAVRNIKTGELMAELSSKGDFGFLGARKAGAPNKFIPINEAERVVQQADLAHDPPKKSFRSINIINLGNLDRRFHYRGNVLKGTYEVWLTTPLCTRSDSFISFNFLDPITAVKTTSAKNKVWLVQVKSSVFYHNIGISRFVLSSGLRIDARDCGFGEDFKGGYFYTDADGNFLRTKSGKNTVRQYIKTGFSLSMSGSCQVTE